MPKRVLELLAALAEPGKNLHPLTDQTLRQSTYRKSSILGEKKVTLCGTSHRVGTPSIESMERVNRLLPTLLSRGEAFKSPPRVKGRDLDVGNKQVMVSDVFRTRFISRVKRHAKLGDGIV